MRRLLISSLIALYCSTTGSAQVTAATMPGSAPASLARLGVTFSGTQAETQSESGSELRPDSDAVVVLPKFNVRDSRLPFTEEGLLTAKGRLEAAKQRHLSPLYRTTFGPLSFAAAIYFNPLLLLSGMKPNEPEAMVLYEQEARLQRLHESTDLIKLIERTDPQTYLELRKSVDDTFRHQQVPQTRRGE